MEMTTEEFVDSGAPLLLDVGSMDLKDRARYFCDTMPHRMNPYSKRNWGGPLHSLCSYQGKLKPAIAHFLISWFTESGDVVVDPMAGVGTIPLEARRQGRIGIANDLSPLAVPFDVDVVWRKGIPVLTPRTQQEIPND